MGELRDAPHRRRLGADLGGRKHFRMIFFRKKFPFQRQNISHDLFLLSTVFFYVFASLYYLKSVI